MGLGPSAAGLLLSASRPTSIRAASSIPSRAQARLPRPTSSPCSPRIGTSSFRTFAAPLAGTVPWGASLAGGTTSSSSSSRLSSGITCAIGGETMVTEANAGAADPRLQALREAMKAAGEDGVDAYIIPNEDPHMSEYAPACDNRRAFISGFTGSAGTAVVTTSSAALWTDGRYFLQAEKQLGPGWTLMKAGVPGTPEIAAWLISQLPAGGRVGIDPFLHTIDAATKMKKELEAKGCELVPVYGNLVDKAWGSDRPAAPKGALVVHPIEWAGKTVAEKLAELQSNVEEAGADSLLVTMLDEVAWSVNLRGEDVHCNPVFVSYAVLTNGVMTLYIDQDKVVGEVAEHLAESGIKVKAYEDMLEDVKALAASGKKIAMDSSKVSYAIAEAAESAVDDKGTKRKADGSLGKAVVEMVSPIAMAKAIKNPAEMSGMAEAHLRDGVAVARFLCQLEKTISNGETLSEVEIDRRITSLRKLQGGFKQCSFDTIAGEGPNGAVIHYRAEPGTCRTVTSDSMLLIDSGGQYECGTTDVTRTLHTGTPSAHQVKTFTAVLQGHIALASATFPPGTPGIAIDALARGPLWSLGLNYRHGTGHGVGAALNVHEGPHTISTRYWNTTPLKEGMIVSNEPGYYEDGAFGIRIENLMKVVQAETPFKFGGETYLSFYPLTLIPIQRKLLDVDMLKACEVKWIDNYHQRVWNEVSPRMKEAEEALAWLKDATRPLKTTSIA